MEGNEIKKRFDSGPKAGLKAPWDIIKELEATNSRLEKEQILKDNFRNTEFKEGLKLALDPLITFGVKQIPEKTGEEEFPNTEPFYKFNPPTIAQSGGVVHEQLTQAQWFPLDFKSFTASASKLQLRLLTGNAARDHIQYLIDSTQEADEWNYWYRRILLKDLKCGISVKTVTKVYGKHFMPVFGCMLAKDGQGKESLYEGKEVIGEFKYDGVRCLAIIKNDNCTLYSRSGKVFDNFPKINKMLSKPMYNNMVFDGELMGKDFQLLMKKLNKKHGWNEEDMETYFAIFDVLPLNEFLDGKSTKTQIERKNQLDEIMRNDPDIFWDFVVQTINYEIFDLSTADGQRNLRAFNDTAIGTGFEGLMIKPQDGYYETKRTNAWIKIKPFIEVTLELIEIEEGTGRNAGKLGALVCKGQEQNKLIKVSVGSGLSDDDRDSIWSNPEDYIGRLVEVRADALTKAEDSDHWSLRFPRFKGFRGFEPGEKL